MNQELINKIEKSKYWDIATSMINNIIDNANESKVKLTLDQADALREMRLLYVIKNDKEVFELASNEILNQFINI